MRLAKAAMAALLTLALAAPAAAHHVPVAEADSDSDAFALYLAEHTAQSDGVVSAFMAYKFGKLAERSDLAKAAQTALVITVEHMAGLDVRPCFAQLAALSDEFYAVLIRYFEVVGPSPALAEALYAFAGSLFTAITGSVTETVASCAPSEAA